MSAISWLVEPGFFSTSAVQNALLAGGVVGFTSGVAGTFVVLRRQSFAGEALGDVGATGGSGAYLLGVNPLWGFAVAALAAAGAIERVDARRAQGRDLATGVVLGAALGLAALFLYLDTTHSSTTGATISVLFGSLFVIDTAMIPLILSLSAAVLVTVVALYRMLLLTTLGSDLAEARGVPVRLVGTAYLLAVALAVSMSALTIGAVLATALLIGPAAIALRLAIRPGVTVLVAGAIGLVATWLGILLAYDSYYWPPVQHGWPVSFLVVALIFIFYLLATAYAGVRRRRVARVINPRFGALGG